MKPLHLPEDIVPIHDLETRASEVLKHLRDSHRPAVITQDGRAAAALISPEDFDRLRERDRFMAAVQEGLADVEAGRVLETHEVDRELDLEFGPLNDELSEHVAAGAVRLGQRHIPAEFWNLPQKHPLDAVRKAASESGQRPHNKDDRGMIPVRLRW